MSSDTTRSSRLFATALLIGFLVGCSPNGDPEILVGVEGCDTCGMVIDDKRQACLFVVDKQSHKFCSPGCLLQAHDALRKGRRPPPEQILFADYETQRLLSHRSVTFLLTSHLPTVMDGDIVAFGDFERARSRVRFGDELVVDWTGLQSLKGDPDRSITTIVSREGLNPEVVEIDRDELVEWVLDGSGLLAELALEVRGYEQLGKVTIPATGDPVRIRLLATRPGEGFPIVSAETGTVLGRLRVRGAHTPDEDET